MVRDRGRPSPLLSHSADRLELLRTAIPDDEEPEHWSESLSDPLNRAPSAPGLEGATLARIPNGMGGPRGPRRTGARAAFQALAGSARGGRGMGRSRADPSGALRSRATRAARREPRRRSADHPGTPSSAAAHAEAPRGRARPARVVSHEDRKSG